jgi:urease accessory protein
MIGERMALFRFGLLGIRHQQNSKSALATAPAMHLFIKRHTEDMITQGIVPKTSYQPEASMHRTALRIAAASLAVVPTVAFAHPGHEGPGLVAGFLHPLGGVDHIIAMVAVGLLAARLGGRALWLVPASFVGTMAVAGLAGMAGLGLPYVETGIALSVVVLAAVAILGVAMPVAAAMGLVAFFAVFHGYAHGAEMPETVSGLAYGAGFVAATALLHGIGIGLGLMIGQVGRSAVRRQA